MPMINGRPIGGLSWLEQPCLDMSCRGLCLGILIVRNQIHTKGLLGGRIFQL